MSFTGVDNLDRSIDKANVWLADIDAGFGTSDRHLAYRILRAWLHNLRDRLTVEVAAHFAAQLPELLRGVFFDGWNPTRVPQKYDRRVHKAVRQRGPGTRLRRGQIRQDRHCRGPGAHVSRGGGACVRAAPRRSAGTA